MIFYSKYKNKITEKKRCLLMALSYKMTCTNDGNRNRKIEKLTL